MRTLADVARDVENNVAVRRDPVEQLSITSIELLEAIQFFEDTLQMNVSKTYLLDLFRDLRHKVERREITIDGLRSALEQYRQISIAHAQSLDVVGEQLINEKIKVKELAAMVRAADAREAFEFNAGQDNAIEVMVHVLSQEWGSSEEETRQWILEHVARENARRESEETTEEIDAA